MRYGLWNPPDRRGRSHREVRPTDRGPLAAVRLLLWLVVSHLPGGMGLGAEPGEARTAPGLDPARSPASLAISAVGPSTGLSMPRPYERGKIPVVFVHGLWGSERQWGRMVRELGDDATLGRRYQFWTFGYTTGDPLPDSASRLRRALRLAREGCDPAGTDAAFDRLVVVGHSLGGVVAKMMAHTTGLALWRTISPNDPAGMSGTAGDLRILRDAYIYERVPEVRRLIFIATPHRGSPLAGSSLGVLGAGFCRAIGDADGPRRRLLAANIPGFFTPGFRRAAPTSVGQLEPGGELMEVLRGLGVDHAVPFHSIIATGKREDRPIPGDGIVPLASARIDGAASERLVRAEHACLEEADVIREIARILREHARP